MSGRASLRVGVPALLTKLPARTSVARIWERGLELLRADVDVVVDDGPLRRWRRRRVDVWLTDGHQGPLDVREPVVAHLHEASWSDPELRPLFEPAFLERYEGPSAAAAAAARELLTVSQSSKDQIVAAYGVDPDRVHVAYNGVDHDVYRPLPQAGDRSYVLYVSTVHPRKNLGALRSALAELAGQGHPVPLVLVAAAAADRADSDDLVRAAEAPIAGIAQPVVNHAGADDAEVARLMAGAAVLCAPSLMEGFGMAVAEAMACGTPVVVSDRGALPEVVGDAGVVVEPTAAGIAGGLREVLLDPARAADLGARAAARAARFTWPAMVATWRHALERAVA